MTKLKPVLSAHWDEADSFTIEGYRRNGGYKAVTKALDMDADAVIQLIKDSGLRGRGGAGFPTGMKWGFIPQNDGKEHYLVVNADESEPGTCKDIPLLMANPHALVEGIIIASYAIRANYAFIYLRGEVVHVYRRVLQAIEDAYNQIIEIAENVGFSVEQLLEFGAQKRKKTTRKSVEPRYRNKNNSEETWTGRGKQPRWLVAEIEKGAKLEDFLI